MAASGLASAIPWEAVSVSAVAGILLMSALASHRARRGRTLFGELRMVMD
ncbi:MULTISPECIES: hypothetical protein [Streptomyces]|nr:MULTISPECIES: hypothetical protein [Streptomyces]